MFGLEKLHAHPDFEATFLTDLFSFGKRRGSRWFTENLTAHEAHLDHLAVKETVIHSQWTEPMLILMRWIAEVMKNVLFMACAFHLFLNEQWQSSRRNEIQINWCLTGWWYTYPLKNISQLGWLSPIYGKIKVMFQTTNQWCFIGWLGP